MDYGYIALEGGAEFGGQMALPDRRFIELAGGPDIPIVIIPTAAAPDNNRKRAGENGRRWFISLGANGSCGGPVAHPSTGPRHHVPSPGSVGVSKGCSNRQHLQAI